jgi:hypothetical protein
VRHFSRGVAAAMALAALAAVGDSSSFAQGDWHIVERRATEPAPAAAGTAGQHTQSNPSTFVVCGEDARGASEPYDSIVEQLNQLWGADIHVYESVAANSPHASSGGCIFYNRKYLAMLFERWMNVQDPEAVRPMLYAIFAHEMGHELHGDTEPGATPARERELSADRFAGYSLERLGMRRLDPTEVTAYYQLTGDDFTGGDGTHGSGAERASAFEDGWHRAALGLREQDVEPAGGLGEP